MNIKIRLIELNKRQVDLLSELRKRGFPRLNASLLSNYINKRSIAPQAKSVLALCEKILAEWSEIGVKDDATSVIRPENNNRKE